MAGQNFNYDSLLIFARQFFDAYKGYDLNKKVLIERVKNDFAATGFFPAEYKKDIDRAVEQVYNERYQGKEESPKPDGNVVPIKEPATNSGTTISEPIDNTSSTSSDDDMSDLVNTIKNKHNKKNNPISEPIDNAPSEPIDNAPSPDVLDVEAIYQANRRTPTPFTNLQDLKKYEYSEGFSGNTEEYLKHLNAPLPDDVARSFAKQGLDISDWYESLRDTISARGTRRGFIEDYNYGKDFKRPIQETGKRLVYQDANKFGSSVRFLELINDAQKQIDPVKDRSSIWHKLNPFNDELIAADRQRYILARKKQSEARRELKRLAPILKETYNKYGLKFDKDTVKRVADFVSQTEEANLFNNTILSTGDIDYIKSGKPFKEENTSAPAPVETSAPIESPIEPPTTNAPDDMIELEPEAFKYGKSRNANAPIDLSSVPADRDPLKYPTDHARSTYADKNRAKIQALFQTVLEQNPHVSNNFIKSLARRRGMRVTSSFDRWGNELREAMGLETGTREGQVSPKTQQFADAAAYAREIIATPNAELMQDRDVLEGLGLVGPLADNGGAATFEKRKRKARRDALKEMRRYNKLLSNEDVDEEELEAQRKRHDEAFERYQKFEKGEDPDGKPEDIAADEVKKKAQEVLDQVEEMFDVITGKFKKTDVKPDEKTSTFIDKVKNLRDAEATLYNDGETKEQRRRRESRSGGTGFSIIDQIINSGNRWQRRGESAGSVVDAIFRKKGGPIPPLGSGPAGQAIGKLLGPIGLLIGSITALVGIGKKLYQAVQKSIQATWDLAPYNGRIGATKAQFEGHEFLRKTQFAAETEDERVDLVAAWDELLDASMELRVAFAEVGLYIQKGFLDALKAIVNWVGEVKGGVKDTKEAIEGTKESQQGQKRQREQGEIINEGNLARRYYETGEIDMEAVQKVDFGEFGKEGAKVRKRVGGYGSPGFNGASEPTFEYDIEAIKKLLDEHRDQFEDSIAYNDVLRGNDFFQKYQGIEGGSPNDVTQIQQQILGTLDNIHIVNLNAAQSAAETEKAAKEAAKAAKETAQNTRKEGKNAQQQAIFLAMGKVAGMYAPKGGEVAADPDGNSRSFGATQEKQYGRFASATQTNWGRK